MRITVTNTAEQSLTIYWHKQEDRIIKYSRVGRYRQHKGTTTTQHTYTRIIETHRETVVFSFIIENNNNNNNNKHSC